MSHHLPHHLRFLEAYLDAPHRGLAAYFPETANGLRLHHRGEAVFAADGIGYLGDTDGTMVPIAAAHLEPEPENTFHADKFSALVEAIEAGTEPIVTPGYADLTMDDGVLTAQVKDGNHRTFAAIAAGADFAWVRMSDRTRQDLDRREGVGTEALYRAIRKAQREAAVPLFTRHQISKVKTVPPALLAAERRLDEIDVALHAYYVGRLRQFGYAAGAYTPFEQEERARLFWKTRLRELVEDHTAAGEDGAEWAYQLDQTKAAKRAFALDRERDQLTAQLYDARRAAGLDPRTERFDPTTGKVVNSLRR